MVVIAESYPVYGIVTDATVAQSGATVYIKDSGTAVILNSLTDAAGKYSIDLYDYATDGNTISIWAFKEGKTVTGTPFTLDVANKAHRADLALLTTTLAETLTLTDSKTQQFNKALSDSLTITDQETQLYSKTLTDALTLIDAVITGATILLADNLTISDGLTLQFNKLLTDTLTLTDNLTKIFNKLLSETLTLTDDLTKQFSTTFAETLTLTDAQIQQFNKLLSDTVTLSEVLTSVLHHAAAPGMLKMYSRNEQNLRGYSKNEQKQFIIKEDD